MLWTTEQIVGLCMLLLVAFFLGYIRGRISERRALRQYILSNILGEMKDIEKLREIQRNLEEERK